MNAIVCNDPFLTCLPEERAVGDHRYPRILRRWPSIYMRVEVQDGDWLVTVMLRESAEDREYLSKGRVNECSTIEGRWTHNSMISAECNDERVRPSF
jgi:hypothetical protein